MFPFSFFFFSLFLPLTEKEPVAQGVGVAPVFHCEAHVGALDSGIRDGGAAERYVYVGSECRQGVYCACAAGTFTACRKHCLQYLGLLKLILLRLCILTPNVSLVVAAVTVLEINPHHMYFINHYLSCLFTEHTRRT